MLTWNVYIENINARRIEVYNIFDYGNGYLLDELKKMKNESESKEEFLDKMDRELKYRFWSKCEWEIILSDWPPSKKFNEKKVDVYQQIRLNWDVFGDYVWKNL